MHYFIFFCGRDDNFTVGAEDVGTVRGVEIAYNGGNTEWFLNKVSFEKNSYKNNYTTNQNT